jgi:transposase
MIEIALACEGCEKRDARIKELERQKADLEKRMREEEARRRELEARLNQNSGNSSLPPSTDWSHRARPKPKSLRERSGRSPGAQLGHVGSTLKAVAKPDRVVTHEVKECGRCHRSLDGQSPDRVEKRQVFDVPTQKIEVTEHQAEVKTCLDCGEETRGEFPPQVQQSVQYGTGLKSMVLYLTSYQFMPYERQQEFFRDIYDHTISQGTLVHVQQEGYDKLEATQKAIREAIIQSPVTHHDETGQHIGGKRYWLHVASTPLWPVFRTSRERYLRISA